MPKKLIISVCTSTYVHGGRQEELPELEIARQNLQNLFTGRLGYEPALEGISENPTAQELNMGLSEWFHKSEREGEDLVVIYYTGHGEITGHTNRFFLLTTDFKYPHYTASAFPLDQLGDMIFMDRSGGGDVRNVLLLVDACHSGAGGLELMKKLEAQFKRPGDDKAFYVLAAAFPEQIAMKGLFVNAIKDILNDPATAGAYQRAINLEQMTAALTKRLKPYRPMLLSMFAGETVPEFFPNPFYREHLAPDLTQEQIQRAIAHPKLTEFWGPRSRGVDAENQTGWYFSGRTKITQEVSAWFTDSGLPNVLLITGQPGAGKSAFLSRFVTASDPVYRERMPKTVQQQMAAVYSAVDTSILSRNKTFTDIVTELAETLEVGPEIPAIVAAITAKTDQKFYSIVLDALDEARQPVQIIRDLIGPLSAINNVRILVGTRQELIRYFKSGPLQKHIDNEHYTTPADLQEYALNRLSTDESGTSPNPFLNRKELAETMAGQIAATANPNFLLAKLLVDKVLSGQALISELQTFESPLTVSEAFSAYFKTFGDREEMVRDLLLPLALAEGPGFPWGQLWAAAASAMAGIKYENSDISTLMQAAGSLIVESTIEGQSVYRLYHQALADTLLQGVDIPVLQQKIFQTLIDTVPLHFDGSRKNWQLAGPYILNYLSAHSGKAASLSSVVHDAAFLLYAQPDHLYSDLQEFQSQVPAKLFYAYKNIFHLIKTKPRGEAAANLLLQSMQQEFAELDFASVAAGLFAWRPDWVIWDNVLPCRVIAEGGSELTFAGVTEFKGRAAALVGRADGKLEIWDLLSGERQFQHRAEAMTYIRDMALLETKNGTFLVSKGAERKFSVITIETESSNVFQLPEEVYAFCLLSTTSGDICLAVDKATLLSSYTLPDLKPIPGQIKLLQNYNFGLLPLVIDGKQYLWAAGEFRGPGDPMVYPAQHLLTVPELEFVWQDKPRPTGMFDLMQKVTVEGRELLVVNADTPGKAELWQLIPPVLLFNDIKFSQYTAIYTYERKNYKLNAGYNHLSVWELSFVNDTNNDLQAKAVFEMPEYELDGYQFRYFPGKDQRPMMLGRTSGHLNIWDVQEIMAFNFDREPSPLKMKAECSAYDPRRPTSFFIGGKNGILELELGTGRILSTLPITEYGNIKYLWPAAKPGTLYAGSANGQLMIVHYEEPARPPEVFAEYHELVAMRVVSYKEKELVIASVGDNDIYHVAIIDPTTREIFNTGSTYALKYGEGDKALFGLAAYTDSQCFRLAFASRYGKVMVAAPSMAAPYPGYSSWKVPHTGNEYTRGLTIAKFGEQYLLAAGTDDGNLAVWNLETGFIRSAAAGVHLGRIRQLLFVQDETRTVLISAGVDGIIRIWTETLQPVLSIEVGAEITTLLSPKPSLLIAGTDKGLFRISLLQIF